MGKAGYGFCGNGGGGSGSGGGGVKQKFVATAGQTVFTVSTFTANDNTLVFIRGSEQENIYTRVGNVFTFTTPITLGTEVVFYGGASASGTPTGLVYTTIVTNPAGQTLFNAGFALTTNSKFIAGNSVLTPSQVTYLGNTATTSVIIPLGTEVTIYQF